MVHTNGGGEWGGFFLGKCEVAESSQSECSSGDRKRKGTCWERERFGEK